MKNQDIKRVIDTGLSPLTFSKQHERRIVQATKGEIVVKRKMSLGLVMAMVLILLAVVAVAATFVWENYVPQAKQIEHEQGSFSSWNLDDKTDLIRFLVESKYIDESEETKQLFAHDVQDMEAHQIADNLIVALAKVDDVRDISIDVLTYALMGFFETWTPEQRVWWQEITNMHKSPTDLSIDTFVMPNESDLPEDTAVEIAKSATIDAFDLESNYFSKNSGVVADLYVTEQRPAYRRWNITLNVYRENDSSYVEESYCVIVDHTGHVIADPDINALHIQELADMQNAINHQRAEMDADAVFQMVKEFWDTYDKGIGFMSLSLDAKAYFSANVRPVILQAIKDNPEKYEGNTYLPLHEITYEYGLPGPQHLTQDAAIAVAKKAIVESHAIEMRILDLYTPYVYFDITNKDKPLWKFYFTSHTPSMYDLIETLPDEAWGDGYKVELDAVDGTITTLWEDSKIANPDETPVRFM